MSEPKSKYGNMVDLLALQKQFILNHLGAGDAAVDFTMGNGHDTEFLSRTVGEHGHVFAFDVQEAALTSTRARLEASGCPQNYTLLLASHHRVKEFVTSPIKAGMFNLGYLPGSDKSVTTMRETTLPAIKAAIELLASDGVLLVAIYPGHAEGEAEGKEVEALLSGLDRHVLCATMVRILNSPTSPFFIVIEKK